MATDDEKISGVSEELHNLIHAVEQCIDGKLREGRWYRFSIDLNATSEGLLAANWQVVEIGKPVHYEAVKEAAKKIEPMTPFYAFKRAKWEGGK